MSSYFRKFVKDYSRIVEPLTRLTKKNTPWIWTDEQSNAVSQVKLILTTRPVLSIFDPLLNTELHTDASSLGFGAMLIQISNEGLISVTKLHPNNVNIIRMSWKRYLSCYRFAIFALIY